MATTDTSEKGLEALDHANLTGQDFRLNSRTYFGR